MASGREENSSAHLSLERFINRKRLFVRVQANVPRELFIQKLNSAFPGARINVGNLTVAASQRVADINYDSAAEAQQALRRNRFKLKVGGHDADITYQIERKDVVEKLAGEWGCRFMVVVKNLPPGEISCSELSEMFETAGEIFTIKILPGNRGEPYALVQYVEEVSVDTSIQQINQQKLQGAVLYVERHLKARRQNNGQHQHQQPTAAPPAAATATAAPAAQSAQQQQQHTTAVGATSGRATTAAGAVAGGAAHATAPPVRTTAAAVAASGQLTSQPSGQTPASAHSHNSSTFQSQSAAPQQPASAAPATAVTVATGPPAQSQTSLQSPLSSTHSASGAAWTPSTQAGKAIIDTSSNSLFSNHYIMSRQDSSQYPNGTTPPAATAAADGRINIFSSTTDMSLPAAHALGGAGLATSPSALLGQPNAIGGGSLLSHASGGGAPPGLGLLCQTGALGSLAGVGSSVPHQVLTPMLDLFSHLREPVTTASGPLSNVSHESLTNGGNAITTNANGMHGGGANTGGYAGMLLRTSTSSSANATATAAGVLSPTANGVPGAVGVTSHGSIHTTQPAGLVSSTSQPGSRSSVPAPGVCAPPPMNNFMSSLPAANQQNNTGLSSASQSSQQQQLHQQQMAAAAAAAAVNLGLPRISIRDSLRLALGRLEEMVTCPITGEIMKDPVVAADGYSYERAAIQSWMAAHSVSPLSGEVLAHKVLTSNRLAKDIIADILPQP